MTGKEESTTLISRAIDHGMPWAKEWEDTTEYTYDLHAELSEYAISHGYGISQKRMQDVLERGTELMTRFAREYGPILAVETAEDFYKFINSGIRKWKGDVLDYLTSALITLNLKDIKIYVENGYKEGTADSITQEDLMWFMLSIDNIEEDAYNLIEALKAELESENEAAAYCGIK